MSTENQPKRMDKIVKSLDDTVDSWKQSVNFKAFKATRKISFTAWVAFLFSLLSCTLSFVTFVAPGWAWTLEIRGREQFEGECYGSYGLWYACWYLVEDTSRQYCHLLNTVEGLPAWWQGCQALATLALCSAVGSFASLCAYICIKSFNRTPFIITSVTVTAFAATFFSIPLFVVFLAQFLIDAYWCCPGLTLQMVEYHLFYCFGIAAGTPVVHLITAVCAMMELMSLRHPPEEEQYPESTNTSVSGYPQGQLYPGMRRHDIQMQMLMRQQNPYQGMYAPRGMPPQHQFQPIREAPYQDRGQAMDQPPRGPQYPQEKQAMDPSRDQPYQPEKQPMSPSGVPFQSEGSMFNRPPQREPYYQ